MASSSERINSSVNAINEALAEDAWMGSKDASGATFAEVDPPVPGFRKTRLDLDEQRARNAEARARRAEHIARIQAEQEALSEERRAHFAKYGIQEMLPIILALPPALPEAEAPIESTMPVVAQTADEIGQMEADLREYMMETGQY